MRYVYGILTRGIHFTVNFCTDVTVHVNTPYKRLVINLSMMICFRVIIVRRATSFTSIYCRKESPIGNAMLMSFVPTDKLLSTNLT